MLMRHACRALLPAAALIFALGACTDGDHAPQAGGTAATQAADAEGPIRHDRRHDDANFIELQIDGETYRADTASSFGQRFQGDPSDPRYDVTMSGGWIGRSEMSIVELRLLNIDGESRTLTLDGADSRGPAVVLQGIPGRRNTRWRSVSGTVHLHFEDGALAGAGMARIGGRFDATLRKLRASGDDVTDDGETLRVRGRFEFKAGAI